MHQPEKLIAFSVLGLLPPSVNHYWAVTMYRGRDGNPRRGRKLTPEARAWKEAVAIFCGGRSVAPETDAERRKAAYRVEVHLYYGKGQRLDPDNAGKACVDGLKDCGCIHADHNVEFHVIPHRDERDNPENPRTLLIVERL